MITLLSSDNMSFSVYCRALLKDSKRFKLQQKYQSLDDTKITSSDCKVLSYYVDFINEGTVVLNKQYEKELLVLADYLKSDRFTHEIKWQCVYKDIMKYYIGVCDNKKARGTVFNIIDNGLLCYHVDVMLRTMSSHILDMMLTHNVDVMLEMESDIKSAIIDHMFPGTHITDVLWEYGGVGFDCIKYNHLLSVQLFESVYGTQQDIQAIINESREDMYEVLLLKSLRHDDKTLN